MPRRFGNIMASAGGNTPLEFVGSRNLLFYVDIIISNIFVAGGIDQYVFLFELLSSFSHSS